MKDFVYILLHVFKIIDTVKVVSNYPTKEGKYFISLKFLDSLFTITIDEVFPKEKIAKENLMYSDVITKGERT